MKEVKVSIIIPVYNVEPYIEICLRSLMLQTYAGPMECIIVDDGGTDKSIAIADCLVSAYEGPIQFEIIHHDHNRGLSAARNTGLRKAVGEYIFFLDSDDEITENCLEKMMAVVSDNPEVELVQGRYTCHRNGKEMLSPKVIRKIHACSNDEVRDCFFLYNQFPMAAWNKLMKRALIEENKLTFIEGLLYEDTPWTYCWLKYISNAFFLSDVTYHYRIRPNSILTGTASDLIETNRLRGYHHIITHLTPGYEGQEIKRIVPSFVGLFLHHSYHIPELMDDLKIIWHFAWKNREYKLCANLGICFIFRKSKIVDRGVYSVLYRVRHPSQIAMDFVRLLRRAKRNISL